MVGFGSLPPGRLKGVQKSRGRTQLPKQSNTRQRDIRVGTALLAQASFFDVDTLGKRAGQPSGGVGAST